MRERTRRILGYALIVAAFLWPLSAARAQPTTQPADVPEARQLRTLADAFERAAQDAREQSDTINQLNVERNRLLAEVERLTAQAWTTWKPGTQLVAGGIYLLKGPVAIPVRVAGVTFIGGPDAVYPEGGIGIDIRTGGDQCTTRRVYWSHPNPTEDRPGGKFKMKECIVTVARNTTVEWCVVGSVDTFITPMIGSDGTTVTHNEGFDDLRSYACYVGGGNNVTFTHNIIRRATRGRVESPLRFTSQKDAAGIPIVPRAGLVAFNDITGDAPGKNAIDARNLIGAVITDNVLRGPEGGTQVRMRVGTPLTEGTGAVDYYIARNDIYGGIIQVFPLAKDVSFERNTFHWQTPGPNQAIYIDGKGGQAANIRATGNTGESPVAQKALVGVSAGSVIPGLNISGDNLWSVKP